MGASIDWTLKAVRGLISIRANAIAPDTFDPDTLKEIIHECVCDVAEQLGEAGSQEYLATQDLTMVSDIATISTYRIDQILAIRSSTSGIECFEKGTKEFERERSREQIVSGSKTVIWTRQGASIEFSKGSTVTYGTLKMIFKRFPTKASAETDTLDVPDKWVPLVIAKAEAKLYEMMNMLPPQTVSDRISAGTDRIRAINREEKQSAKGVK
jgi:hypothetical protein